MLITTGVVVPLFALFLRASADQRPYWLDQNQNSVDADYGYPDEPRNYGARQSFTGPTGTAVVDGGSGLAAAGIALGFLTMTGLVGLAFSQATLTQRLDSLQGINGGQPGSAVSSGTPSQTDLDDKIDALAMRVAMLEMVNNMPSTGANTGTNPVVTTSSSGPSFLAMVACNSATQSTMALNAFATAFTTACGNIPAGGGTTSGRGVLRAICASLTTPLSTFNGLSNPSCLAGSTG